MNYGIPIWWVVAMVTLGLLGARAALWLYEVENKDTGDNSDMAEKVSLLAACVAAPWVAMAFGFPQGFSMWLLLLVMIVLTWIDLRFQILPDALTVGPTILALLGAWFIPSAFGFVTSIEALRFVASGIIVGGGSALFVYVVFGKLVFGRQHFYSELGKPMAVQVIPRKSIVVGDTVLEWNDIFATPLDVFKIITPEGILHRVRGSSRLAITTQAEVLVVPCDGIGLGDVKLLALLGAFMGAGAVYPIALIGACAFLVVAMVTRKGIGDRLAFGPYLCLGAATVMIYRITSL